MRYRNSTYALVDGLRDAVATEEWLSVRGMRTKELRNQMIVLTRPVERCIVTPARHNNIFAAIAETVWVLAGRNDLAFLSHYLPRAMNFSDDGRTWRAAYGPRLRNWSGVDQLRTQVQLLRDDATTRRAVISLFDPASDFGDSKDIPCTNWIHFLIRDGLLHMNVAVRSNDIMWGFSGINAFEWSVLHELIAGWLAIPMGEVAFLASSFHLYDYHENRARSIVRQFPGVTCYDFGLKSPKTTVPFDEFDETLHLWLELEALTRTKPGSLDSRIDAFPDPLLGHFLKLIQLYNGSLLGWPLPVLDERLGVLPETDLTLAAYEFFHRGSLLPAELIPHPTIARYWKRYSHSSLENTSSNPARFRQAITNLHAEKTAAYGTSWKRRGEQISILANIARKIDRLQHSVESGTMSRDESLFDTAVDLFVYCLKYQTYLADLDDTVAHLLFHDSASRIPNPYSDGLAGFDYLLSRHELPTTPTDSLSPSDVTVRLIAALESLHDCFELSHSICSPMARFELARSLTSSALKLIEAVVREASQQHRAFLDLYAPEG
jgi:thymidylate synthase